MRPAQTTRGTLSTILRPAESSRTLLASIGYVFVGRAPSCCISMTSTSTCYDCAGAPTRHFMHENGMGCAESRGQCLSRSLASCNPKKDYILLISEKGLTYALSMV